jgi:hypothetical protein
VSFDTNIYWGWNLMEVAILSEEVEVLWLLNKTGTL